MNCFDLCQDGTLQYYIVPTPEWVTVNATSQPKAKIPQAFKVHNGYDLTYMTLEVKTYRYDLNMIQTTRVRNG